MQDFTVNKIIKTREDNSMYAVEKYDKEKGTTIEQWEFESLEDARIKFNNECLEFRKSSETNPKLSILCCEIDEKDEYEEHKKNLALAEEKIKEKFPGLIVKKKIMHMDGKVDKIK